MSYIFGFWVLCFKDFEAGNRAVYDFGKNVVITFRSGLFSKIKNDVSSVAQTLNLGSGCSLRCLVPQ